MIKPIRSSFHSEHKIDDNIEKIGVLCCVVTSGTKHPNGLLLGIIMNESVTQIHNFFAEAADPGLMVRGNKCSRKRKKGGKKKDYETHAITYNRRENDLLDQLAFVLNVVVSC